MIRVTVVLDESGRLRKAAASGHALGLNRGGNIVCAAVTVLLRTAARVLEAKPGVKVSGTAGARGEFQLSIDGMDENGAAFVETVGEYLLQGIRDLEAEFPDDCTLEVRQRR